LVRGARLLALSILIGWSVANAIQRLGDWSLSDMDAYWNAAMRLRDAAPLYPPVADPAAVDIYKYAPWFAWAWVPLTFLPKALVGVMWSTILAGASGVALLPVIRHLTLTRLAVGAFFGSLLLWSAASGNVQPLLIAILIHGVDRRSGPIWIGLAASLKVFPLFYALVYAGRREWNRAASAIFVSVVLWLPVLLYDLSDYQGGFADSPNPLLATSPLLYAVGAIVAIVTTVRLARGRRGWVTAATGVFVVLPRVSLIDLTQLLVGVTPRTEPQRDSPDG
jgi:hypothetical protein